LNEKRLKPFGFSRFFVGASSINGKCRGCDKEFISKGSGAEIESASQFTPEIKSPTYF